jgi:hypothetical protein
MSIAESVSNSTFWSRLMENAVGARLFSLLQDLGGRLFYWRERKDEVDYVVELGGRLIAVERLVSFS